MRTSHETKVRDALWRLTEPPASPIGALGVPMPLFARAPYVAVLWVATLATLVALLALGRVRVPRIAKGTVIAISANPQSVTLLLLLPSSARPFVAAGQHAEIDTGHGRRLVLSAARIEPDLLSAATARRRFANQPGVLARLENPKVAIYLAPCGAGGCLTPSVGQTYTARAAIGTRSLASYAVPGT